MSVAESKTDFIAFKEVIEMEFTGESKGKLLFPPQPPVVQPTLEDIIADLRKTRKHLKKLEKALQALVVKP